MPNPEGCFGGVCWHLEQLARAVHSTVRPGLNDLQLALVHVGVGPRGLGWHWCARVRVVVGVCFLFSSCSPHLHKIVDNEWFDTPLGLFEMTQGLGLLLEGFMSSGRGEPGKTSGRLQAWQGARTPMDGLEEPYRRIDWNSLNVPDRHISQAEVLWATHRAKGASILNLQPSAYLNFSDARASTEQIIAVIQSRMTTLFSCRPPNSMW